METKNTSPRVSVVLPVYNGERHIVQAIQSILQQSFNDFELIVIDDGSSDSTPTILKQLQHMDNRIKVITHAKNQGLVSSLKSGLQAVSTTVDYIARMDGDDISHGDRLKLQVEYMDGHKEIGIVGGHLQIFVEPPPPNKDKECKDDTKSETSNIEVFKNGFPSLVIPPSGLGKIHRLPLTSGMIEWNMHFFCCMHHPTVMMRKHVLQLSTYDEEYWPAEDYHLWLRLLPQVRFANVDHVVLYLRKHPHSVSSLHSSLQKEKSILALGTRLRSVLNVSESLLHTNTVRGFLFPSMCAETQQLIDLFERMKKVEHCVLGLNYLTQQEREMIKKDATARLGEVVMHAMKLDQTKAMVIWIDWVKRNPTSLMKNLFQ